MNRIKSAIDNTNDQRYSLTEVKYDRNGNITDLKRNGHTNAEATTFGLMDQLTYAYTGNRLKSVTDIGQATGFKDGTNTSDDYTYDDNGNMVRDLNKGIGDATTDGISYNHLNLPTEVIINYGGSNNGTISYIYDATGVKLQKNVLENGVNSPTDYAGNYIYKNNSLQFFSTPEGYVEPKDAADLSQGYNYIYQYKDHLGNVRLSYTDNNGTTEIVEENNYYPFGLEHKGYNSMINGVENNYMTYQGKELDESLGLNWLDFELRNYDAATARWFSLDPKADAVDLVSSSPYSFALNNPITFRDPEGDCPPGVICIPVIYDAAIRLASNVSDKIDRANHIASGMVETFDDADKRTGGDGISGYRKATIFASRYLKEFGDNFGINDVSVLKEGRNFDGSEASTADYGFAAAAIILPISGKKLKTLGGEGLDALTSIFNKTSNQSKHLDAKHINAAVGDILGNPITINGKTYDHLDEVQNALNGVGNQLGNLNKQIEAGNFSGEVLEAAENMRSSLQKQKDEITDILNRAYNKANE